MARQQDFKTVALTEVNVHILELAAESVSAESRWEFFCECGRRDCTEQVALTLGQYVATRECGTAVLAAGHSPNQSARARELRQDAQVLVAQAKHQNRRAGENVSHARALLLASLRAGERVWVNGRPATFREHLPQQAARVHFDGEDGSRVVLISRVTTRQPLSLA
jgi:hypothetical protein